MKGFLTLLCSVLLIRLVAQESQYCGTQMPEEMTTWLADYKQNNGHFSANGRSGTYYIPLTIHIVGNDAGAGYYKTSDLLDAICRLNEQYLPVGFYFYIQGNIDYINDLDLYVQTTYVGSQVNPYNVVGTVNIYFVQDPAGNCGYFQWTTNGGFIAVKKSCAGPENSTIAHEVGHYFSLPHTFSGWERTSTPFSEPPRASDERVDGSNCHSAGDRFCDTPADFISQRWNCPYNSTKLDYAGNPYNVDGTLFMSYANDACQTRFSPEQIDAMSSYLVSSRSNHLNHPDPEVPQIGTTEAVYPPDSATGIPANYVNLRWRSAEGATQYSLLVTRYFSGVYYNVDTIVSDTSIVINHLDSGYVYYWKVRPFHPANTCAEYTDLSMFRTTRATPITPNAAVNSVSCNGLSDGSISLSAFGGTGPYTYTWQNGDTLANITGLAAGNYRATITDSNNDTLAISLDVQQPPMLTLQFTQDANNLLAVVTGGNPPYSYHWSNNSASDHLPLGSTGSAYSLTVTDQNGCDTSASFVYTSVNTGLDETSVNLYPNPVKHGQTLMVEFIAKSSFTGTMELYNNSGKKLLSVIKEFSAGQRQEEMEVADLPAGLYLLRIQGAGILANRKVMIF